MTIVSPWFIYLLNVVDGILTAITPLTIITGLVTLIYWMGVSINRGIRDDEALRDWQAAWGWKGVLVTTLFIFGMCTQIFVPSKDTLIQMYVAREVTYERVGKLAEAGKSLKEEIKVDILDIIREVRGEDCK
jgi:hypothetical protein